MEELMYPFDPEYLLKKKKSIRKTLLAETGTSRMEKKIAILGGVTTNDIRLMLELFLLNQGIAPVFYESEFDQYYQDGMFPNPELEAFGPDLIYICTSIRNIHAFPEPGDDKETVENKLEAVSGKFEGLWARLEKVYRCPVIQNNFEYPYFRLMGNKDASDMHGRVNFVTRLNCRFYDYAQNHENFYICDINYLSASYGLEKWSDPFYYHMYKYAVAVPAIPYLSFNVANIVKSVYGKNKKALNLDLDNTLWGGVIGDDGADNIEIGQETSLAQTYSEFQEYIRLHRQLGVVLTINSKNDRENALGGLNRPDSVLKPEDFADIQANWDPKSANLARTAQKLSLLPESFVFVDDNPAERAIIRDQMQGTAVPEIEGVEHYVRILDRSGFFETTTLSGDDLKRNQMYRENAERDRLQAAFEDYGEYLKSLEMKGEIQGFVPAYMSRIAQLTNKSNQFNLTTKRYSQSEIESVAKDRDYITLYGKLGDKFGDNGVVSTLIGKIAGEDRDELHMELWLMSCRVLKRDMEYAMMDQLVEKCRSAGIRRIYGYYYPTAKNAMVKNFYELQGFTRIAEDAEGNTTWEYCIPENYENRNKVIEVNGTDKTGKRGTDAPDRDGNLADQ